MNNEPTSEGTVKVDATVRHPLWTFEDYLEAKGFHSDACIATTHPDFYRLARNLWDGLNVIADCRTHDTPAEFAVDTLHDA